MKRFTAFLLSVMLLLGAVPAALAAKKAAATPTPAPREITQDVAEPPAEIQRVLEVAYREWTEVNGKDQGKKNKYTTWFNNYNWGRNAWCAGFVTWCMLEAEIPQEEPPKNLDDVPDEAPQPVWHVKASSPDKMVPPYRRMHRYTQVPQKGFIIVYGQNSNHKVHVGIVYDVVALGDGKYRLTTIEGAMKNTVRMYIFDYDMNAKKQEKNISKVPEEERTGEESKIFTYGYHKSGKNIWYVSYFLMPWIPEQSEP